MTTEEDLVALAKSTNAVQTIHVEKAKKSKRSKQKFPYLLVLDFEATCWDRGDYNKGQSEIIEFPVCLYDVKENNILAEFQQYVMPRERPKLSKFCTELTGIEQSQVDNGVPLPTCLMLLNRWLETISNEHGVKLGENCAFATWSDWDLGTCLRKECKRKRIKKPEIFNSWIDIKHIYKHHYQRPVRGFFEALLDVGMDFEGRQHCGLHDARNTCRLIGKMIEDGASLNITTRNLD